MVTRSEEGQNTMVTRSEVGQNAMVTQSQVGQNTMVTGSQVRQNTMVTQTQVRQNTMVTQTQVRQNTMVTQTQVRQNRPSEAGHRSEVNTQLYIHRPRCSIRTYLRVGDRCAATRGVRSKLRRIDCTSGVKLRLVNRHLTSLQHTQQPSGCKTCEGVTF